MSSSQQLDFYLVYPGPIGTAVIRCMANVLFTKKYDCKLCKMVVHAVVLYRPGSVFLSSTSSTHNGLYTCQANSPTTDALDIIESNLYRQLSTNFNSTVPYGEQ